MKKDIETLLNKLKINYRLIEHVPVWKMEDALDLALDCELLKSLVFKDEKNQTFFLLVCKAEERVNISALAKLVRTSRSKLNFASKEDLIALKTKAGLVSPLDFSNKYSIIISEQIKSLGNVGIHAGSNIETLILDVEDLVKCLVKQQRNLIWM